MKVNFNARVRVKLTDFGKAVLANNHRDLYGKHSEKCGMAYTPDSDGYLETQLWCLFEEFGDRIHMGMTKVPFEDNVIEILEP